jgi:hypothetical protein
MAGAGAGTPVWLPHADGYFLPATLVRQHNLGEPSAAADSSDDADLVVVLRDDATAQAGDEVVMPRSELRYREVLVPGAGVDDLTQLSFLHEAGILDNLRTRFQAAASPISGAGEGDDGGGARWEELQAKFAAADNELTAELSGEEEGAGTGGGHGGGQQKTVYTYCGRICLAVNPYEPLPGLYAARRMQECVPRLSPPGRAPSPSTKRSWSS